MDYMMFNAANVSVETPPLGLARPGPVPATVLVQHNLHRKQLCHTPCAYRTKQCPSVLNCVICDHTVDIN